MIRIINESNYINKLETNEIKRIIEFVFKFCCLSKNTNISIIFVEKSTIHTLNNNYLSKDKPTDVLAFRYNELNYLGEIYICLEIAKKQHHVSNFNEIWFLLIHGILHLIGYDHKKFNQKEIMFKIQCKIINNITILAKSDWYNKKINI